MISGLQSLTAPSSMSSQAHFLLDVQHKFEPHQIRHKKAPLYGSQAGIVSHFTWNKLAGGRWPVERLCTCMWTQRAHRRWC